MSEQKKSLNNPTVEQRRSELEDVNLLVEMFGGAAFKAVERYYVSMGYETGMERLTGLLKRKAFSQEKFLADPAEGVRLFLQGYFDDRATAIPTIWAENNTVFLKTEYCVSCPTFEAEKTIAVCHRDICNLYCRAFVKGMLQVFESLFGEIQINFYNVSSRRRTPETDCVEAFQVVFP